MIIKHYFYNCYFINCNTLCMQLLPLVTISPLLNKQDRGHIDVIREYTVLYFTFQYRLEDTTWYWD